MINAIPDAGEARTPRSILKAGSKVIDWLTWTITQSGVYNAGTVSITAAAPYDEWKWWMQQTEIVVDFFVGMVSDASQYTAADLTLLMTARIDTVKLDPATMTVSLNGRDLSALFMDKKVSGDYRGLTASQIVGKLFNEITQEGGVCGLSAKIDPTKTVVGGYYNADKVQLQTQNTMWTLMTHLAQQEKVQCFVLGKVLYFGNFKSATFGDSVSDEPYSIEIRPPAADRAYPMANVEALSFSHNMALAGNVAVCVSSCQAANNITNKATATATNSDQVIDKGAQSVLQTQKIYQSHPGLSKADCAKAAESLLHETLQHELTMEASMPGDLKLFPWTPVIVSGTGTIHDATYKVAKVSRSFDSKGFKMTVSCQTGSPQKKVKTT